MTTGRGIGRQATNRGEERRSKKEVKEDEKKQPKPKLSARERIRERQTVALQKEIMGVFRQTCHETLLDPEQLEVTVREIQDCFVKREFLDIFTNDRLLESYVARWSPPRALCYFELIRTDPVLSKLMSRPLNVTMLGSGPGAELVAFGAAAAAEVIDGARAEGAAEEGSQKKPMNLGVVDIGSFTSVVKRLAANVNKLAPALGEAAPEAAPEAAAAPKLVKPKYLQLDMMTTPIPPALAKMYSGSHLVTAMFVVNELVQQDKGKALEILGEIVGTVSMMAVLRVLSAALLSLLCVLAMPLSACCLSVHLLL